MNFEKGLFDVSLQNDGLNGSSLDQRELIRIRTNEVLSDINMPTFWIGMRK